MIAQIGRVANIMAVDCARGEALHTKKSKPHHRTYEGDGDQVLTHD
jgi:hypothetical protein